MKSLQDSIKRNMQISIICRPISMIVSYLYVPVVLKYLGVEKYGVWSTILTILSWISYFDIGIGNGLRNKLTESLHSNNGKSRKLVSSAYAFITLIMAGVAAFFSIAASFVNWNKVFGVYGLKENLQHVVVISVVFVSGNFILSICKSVLYALQKAADVSMMELGVQILNMCGVMVCMRISDGNLFIMSCIYGLSMLVVNVFTSVYLYTVNAEIRPSIFEVNFNIGKSITTLGFQFFVIQICALVLYTTDSLIISYLYGAADVTPYSTVNKMFNIIIGLYTALLTPVWSAVTKAKVESGYHDLTLLIRKLRFMMIPFVFGTMLLITVFRPLMDLWLGQSLDYSFKLVLFGGMYCVLSIWCNTYASIANGMELMKISMVTAVVQAVVNIPLSLFLAEVFGMQSAGVLAGTVISMAISAVVQPIAVEKMIKIFERQQT